jgi:hypothetical protein
MPLSYIMLVTAASPLIGKVDHAKFDLEYRIASLAEVFCDFQVSCCQSNNHSVYSDGTGRIQRSETTHFSISAYHINKTAGAGQVPAATGAPKVRQGMEARGCWLFSNLDLSPTTDRDL